MSDVKILLKKRGLKVTPARTTILEVFDGKNYALSFNDLNKELGGALDKVTVYRTLKSFEEGGIIHEVMDGSPQVKYALCHHEDCSKEDHDDAHVHFKCERCNRTYCLESTQIPTIELPQGYFVSKQFVSLQGMCKNCH